MIPVRLFIFLLFCLPQWLWAQNCAPLLPSSVVEVSMRFGEPRISSEMGWKEITNKAASSLEKIGKNNQVFGLTEIAIDTHFNLAVSVVPSDINNIKCGRLTLKVSFETPTPIIYLAQELYANSCAFKEVLEHEKRHVALQKRLLKELLKEVETEMGRVYNGQYFQGDSEQLIQRFNQEVTRFWKPRWENRLAGFSFYHAQEIDTPAESERMGVLCDAELSKIVFKKQ